MGGLVCWESPGGGEKPPDGRVITQACGKEPAKALSLGVSSVSRSHNLSKTSHTFSPLPRLITGPCSGHFVLLHFVSFKTDHELQGTLPGPTDWACEVAGGQ